MSRPYVPPLPPPGKFIESIRETCHATRVAHKIKISETQIRRLLLSPAFTATYHRIVKTSHGLMLPLNFASPLDELNVISTLALLNFGSGYRVPLHQQTGRGAWDSVRAFVLGLYLSSGTGVDPLSAQGMKGISEAQIAELLGVNIHIEKPHEIIKGLTVGEVGGQGWELVKLFKQVLHDTGDVLVKNGYNSLGQFVAEALDEGQSAAASGKKELAAEIVLQRLVSAFPAFQDMALIGDQAVYCFKKALFLIYGVPIRFSSRTAPPFPVPETSHLPICSDNVIPSLLIHLGIIDLSACDDKLALIFPDAGNPQSLDLLLALHEGQGSDNGVGSVSKSVPKAGPILNAEQAYALRSAAVDACEAIVKTAKSLDEAELNGSDAVWVKNITLPDLDAWLWAVAKDRPDYRKLERFVQTDTVFF